MAGHAFAVGEGFQVETFGTKYCGDFYSIKYNAKNNVNLWVYLLSESDVMVSFTPNFQPETTFPMSLSQYLVSDRKTSFIGTTDFEDGSHLTLQGTITFNKVGTVKRLKGTFIESGVLHPDCFSSGNFYSSMRVW